MQKLVCFRFTDENSGSSEEGRVLSKSHSEREADLEQGPGLLTPGWGSAVIEWLKGERGHAWQGACCKTQAGGNGGQVQF